MNELIQYYIALGAVCAFCSTSKIRLQIYARPVLGVVSVALMTLLWPVIILNNAVALFQFSDQARQLERELIRQKEESASQG